jgi:hypothetical protein
MFSGNDVINLEGSFCQPRWKLAVFTPEIGTLPHQLPEMSVHT